MKNAFMNLAVLFCFFLITDTSAQVVARRFEPPIPKTTIQAILNEASGENAYEHIRYLASFARYPNSDGFHRAAEYVVEEAEKIGLSNIKIEAFETGEPSWDYVRATLTITSPEPEKLADTDHIGISLCNNSNDADLEADLVDVGAGTSDQDYEGKDVKGKIVLASGHPRPVQQKALLEHGAAGLVSYFSNSFFGVEPSRDAVSWTRIRATTRDNKPAGFGFMVSPNAGTRLSARLKGGEKIKVHASIKVKTAAPGKIEMVTAEIQGSNRNNDDIVLSAHLDHQSPGANDNASGSAALLEIARTVQSLVRNGIIPQPQRTVRFWWVTEIRGTFLYFYKYPEEAKKLAFNINIDQAGGDKHYRNDLVSIKTPRWLPSFTNDAFDLLCQYMQAHYADVYHKPSTLFVAPSGRQDEPLTFRTWEYAELTDHIVFDNSAINVPSMSLAYPSFHYIHTSEDRLEHIDATTLKRSIFFGAALGIYLATPIEGPRTDFESELTARISMETIRGWSKAFDLLERSPEESIHKDYYRAVAMAKNGIRMYRGALESFSRLGRPNPALQELFSFNSLLDKLRRAYEQRCEQFGVKPLGSELPESGEKVSTVIPRRTIPLGPDYRQWMFFNIPGMSRVAAAELKNFINGKRSLTEIWQLLVSEHPGITLEHVVSAFDALLEKQWVVLEQR